MENNDCIFSEALRINNECLVEYLGIYSSLSSGSENFGARYIFDITSQGELSQIVEKGIPLPGVKYDKHNIDIEFAEHDKFRNNYFHRGDICLGKDFTLKYSEQEIKRTIQEFFDNCQRKGCVLFFSGHGEKGKFYLETKEGEKALYYKEVADYWINRKNKAFNKYLLIIIDACFSGTWVMENEENFHFADHFGIFIQSSCSIDEKSSDIKNKGGLLIWNFKELNTKKENPEMQILKGVNQKPCSIGFYFKIEKYFKLRLMCNSWNDFYIPLFEEMENEDGDYTGEVRNKKKEGKGIYNFHDGSKYQGEFFNNLFEGKGIYYTSDGETYEGSWKKGLKHGKGVYYYENKFRFQGNYEYDFKTGYGTLYNKEEKIYMQGTWQKDQLVKGKIYYSDNEYYIGDVLNDQRYGVGIYIKNKEKFQGYFMNDLKHGFGILIDEFGNTSKGYWENDNLKGPVRKVFADNDSYEGYFDLGEFSGFGKYKFNDGKVYEGEFKEDKKHGVGLYIYSNELDKFEGCWEEDKMTFGKIIFANGDYYEGNIENDYYNDLGIFKSENGSCYKGYWYDNYKHGFGIMKTENGDKYIGSFHLGEFDGFGIFKFSNSNKYIGNFLRNEFSGRGLFQWGLTNHINYIQFKQNYKTKYNNSDKRKKLYSEENFNNSTKDFPEEIDFDDYLEGINILKEGTYSTEIKDDKYSETPNLSTTSDYHSTNDSNSSFIDANNLKIQKNGISFPYPELSREKKFVCCSKNEFYNKNIQLYLKNKQYDNFNRNFSIAQDKESVNISKNTDKSEEDEIYPFFFLGDWKDNKRHGFGCLVDENGKYTGQFIENQKYGKGILVYADQQIYEGDFVKDKRHGKGKQIMISGQKYEGDFFEDKFHGRGIYYFNDSIWYEGEFKNDKRDGFGSLIQNRLDEPRKYEGMWNNDLKHGKMIVIFGHKLRFEGFFQNDAIKGEGKMESRGEYIYTGEFNPKFQKHGKGRIVFNNGDEYEGEFKDGKICGYGKKIMKSSKERYEGYWVDNLMNGFGKMYYSNGACFEGNWLNGKKYGKGIHKWPDGRKVKGLWEKNSLISTMFNNMKFS